jgi:methyl-accepting chemotaxis protein
MKLNTKLLTIIFSMLVVFTLVIMFAVFDSSKKNLYADKEQTLEALVETAYDTMVYYDKLAESGELTLEKAEEMAKATIAEFRYGPDSKDYFWINDYEPNMIMHPLKPSLNGTSLKKNEDKEGKLMFVEMVDVVKAKGQGYVPYLWQFYDDATRLEPKLSYVKGFEKWKWIVGTGIYINDVNAQARANALKVLWIALIVFIIIGISLGFIIKIGIVAPIVTVTDAATALSKGEFEKIKLKAKGEIKALVDSLNGTQALIDRVNAQQVEAAKLANNLKILPTPVYEMDKEFNIVFINDEAAKFAGLTPEECIGKKCFELFKTDDCNTEKCACMRALQTNTSITTNTVARPRTGIVYPITYTGFSIIGPDGKATGILEFVVDQTPVYNVAKQLEITARKVGDVTGRLGSLSNQMSSGAEEMSAQSNQVASATEEINANVATVAASTEQAASNVTNMAAAAEEMSQNVGTVASAIEEMNASLMEVAKNTVEAAQIADDAAGKTENTVGIMSNLSDVARRIDKVVKMISDIADQTNMLALNATIEAASAGEAGKGFAVVAAEVKELAKQTAESTEEIANQIETIQKTAEEASNAVDSVKESITKNREISQSIASSVEQQTATISEISKTVSQTAYASKEVAKNAEEATKGVKEIARSANEMSLGVQEVSKNIQQVNIASNDVSRGGQDVKHQSDSLSVEVETLNQVVGNFDLLDRLK